MQYALKVSSHAEPGSPIVPSPKLTSPPLASPQITFLFVALLFVDAVQRLVKVTTTQDQQVQGGVASNPQGEAAYHGRKVSPSAERNPELA